MLLNEYWNTRIIENSINRASGRRLTPSASASSPLSPIIFLLPSTFTSIPRHLPPSPLCIYFLPPFICFDFPSVYACCPPSSASLSISSCGSFSLLNVRHLFPSVFSIYLFLFTFTSYLVICPPFPFVFTSFSPSSPSFSQAKPFKSPPFYILLPPTPLC